MCSLISSQCTPVCYQHLNHMLKHPTFFPTFFFKEVKLVSGGCSGLNQSKEAAVMLSLWSQSHHPLFIDTELTLEPSLCLPRGTILVMVARCVRLCVCECVCARECTFLWLHKCASYVFSRMCIWERCLAAVFNNSRQS